MRRRSKKTAREYSKTGGRRDFVAFMLKKYPDCMAKIAEICTIKAVDVHEVIPRSAGGPILPPNGVESWQEPEILDQFLTLCRSCHSFITFNPAYARANGYRKKGSSWF